MPFIRFRFRPIVFIGSIAMTDFVLICQRNCVGIGIGFWASLPSVVRPARSGRSCLGFFLLQVFGRTMRIAGV